MFEITLKGAGKRFNRDWIFRHWSQTLTSAESYVVLGGNGSGKSTALRTLLGYAPLSEGSLSFSEKGTPLPAAKAYRRMSFCSPYLELYEELTVMETARFHFSLKPALPEIDPGEIARITRLEHAADRPVKHLSSGMKQRLRLGLALYSDTAVVFLDEPTSNLDRSGVEWYNETVNDVRKDRLFIVASNHQADEYAFCTQKINVEEFKPR
ncbi:MAG: ATP-binding cassette domain-containing protein [Flavobacteriales bacterium]|nr:ATP-binding cassette domain-containing protein [Flavobacteriales bacterium]